MLTTITPYWGRPDTLRIFVRHLENARQNIPHTEVNHMILFVGEALPSWWDETTKESNIFAVMAGDPPVGASIGHWHNEGAQVIPSEWMMKLDIDAMPNVDYFKNLLPILRTAKPRQWFNGGMFYLNQHFSTMMLGMSSPPLTADIVQQIMRNPRSYTANSYLSPQASNFICRRADYLALGGCDDRFMGWGWEDYQQLYMLERHARQCQPLPAKPTIANVTNWCRDLIGRPKARELFGLDPSLCLMHKWHAAVTPAPGYKSHSNANREVLLDYILKTW